MSFSEIEYSNEIECLKRELCLERGKTQRMESDLRLVSKKLHELHSHYMICNTSNSSSGICICKEPPKPKAVCDVNLMDSLSLIAQPGSPNCAINSSVNTANTNGVNPIECNLNSNLNCKVMISQAHSQYNQRSPSHNSGFVEKSLTAQPVCRNRTTNRIKGNKGQDVVVKSIEHNVNKNKSNKPMKLQNNHEFDHNVPTYCEPLSIKLLGSLPFIAAAKPFKSRRRKFLIQRQLAITMESTIKAKTKKRSQEHIISITRLHIIIFEAKKISLLRVRFYRQIHLVIYPSSKHLNPSQFERRKI